MFYLNEIEHSLRLPNYVLNLPLNEAIKGELEGLFLDKVIAKLGLCISVYDNCCVEGGFVFPGDAVSMYMVRFRLVIFLPFVGEVIAARLKESASDGLRWITRCSDGWGPISWWPGFDAVQGWCSQRVDENGQWVSQSPCA